MSRGTPSLACSVRIRPWDPAEAEPRDQANCGTVRRPACCGCICPRFPPDQGDAVEPRPYSSRLSDSALSRRTQRIRLTRCPARRLPSTRRVRMSTRLHLGPIRVPSWRGPRSMPPHRPLFLSKSMSRISSTDTAVRQSPIVRLPIQMSPGRARTPLTSQMPTAEPPFFAAVAV